jgi:hypothetical protein
VVKKSIPEMFATFAVRRRLLASPSSVRIVQITAALERQRRQK